MLIVIDIKLSITILVPVIPFSIKCITLLIADIPLLQYGIILISGYIKFLNSGMDKYPKYIFIDFSYF